MENKRFDELNVGDNLYIINADTFDYSVCKIAEISDYCDFNNKNVAFNVFTTENGARFYVNKDSVDKDWNVENGNVNIVSGDVNVLLEYVNAGIARLNNIVKRLSEYQEVKKEEYEVWNCDVMTTYNSHSPELVAKINKAFKDPSCLEHLATILYALAQRYDIEVVDKLGIAITSKQMAFDNANFILMNVCDDNDLQIILKYL